MAAAFAATMLGCGGGRDGTGAADDTGPTDGGGAASDVTGTSSSTTPGGVSSSSEGGTGGFAASRVLYLNFDGGTFMAGPEDATRDQPGSVTGVGPYAAAPGYVARDLVVDGVTAALAPFDVAVTDQRPAEGDYDMVVFTESPGGAGVGAAIPDCGDANPHNVGLVYAMGNTNLEVSAALAIFGQTIGLELTEGDDAMARVNQGATDYDDACVQIFAPRGCAHPGCPMGQQNAYAEVLAAVGLRP